MMIEMRDSLDHTNKIYLFVEIWYPGMLTKSKNLIMDWRGYTFYGLVIVGMKQNYQVTGYDGFHDKSLKDRNEYSSKKDSQNRQPSENKRNEMLKRPWLLTKINNS